MDHPRGTPLNELTEGSQVAEVWDWGTGEHLRALRHGGSVTQARFSPDGSPLASVSADGTVRVWALDLDDLVDAAEHGLTRTLTDDECRQYLHARQCP